MIQPSFSTVCGTSWPERAAKMGDSWSDFSLIDKLAKNSTPETLDCYVKDNPTYKLEHCLQGKTILAWMISLRKKEKISLVSHIIKISKNIINAGNKEGVTPLLWCLSSIACIKENRLMEKYEINYSINENVFVVYSILLCSWGAHVNLVNFEPYEREIPGLAVNLHISNGFTYSVSEYSTPLHLATKIKDSFIIQMLLCYGGVDYRGLNLEERDLIVHEKNQFFQKFSKIRQFRYSVLLDCSLPREVLNTITHVSISLGLIELKREFIDKGIELCQKEEFSEIGLFEELINSRC